MLEILFSLIFFISLSVFAGFFCSKYILNLNIKLLRFSEIGLIGITFLTFLSFFIHFFFPLSANINLIVIVLIFILGAIKNIHLFINYLKKNYLILFVSLFVVLLMTLNYNPHEDYGFYHLPYIINLISENPNITTRKIAQKVGISNGTAYYLISALVEKGFVKLGAWKVVSVILQI